jgi:hypothetical protein
MSNAAAPTARSGLSDLWPFSWLLRRVADSVDGLIRDRRSAS